MELSVVDLAGCRKLQSEEETDHAIKTENCMILSNFFIHPQSSGNLSFAFFSGFNRKAALLRCLFSAVKKGMRNGEERLLSAGDDIC